MGVTADNSVIIDLNTLNYDKYVDEILAGKKFKPLALKHSLYDKIFKEGSGPSKSAELVS